MGEKQKKEQCPVTPHLDKSEKSETVITTASEQPEPMEVENTLKIEKNAEPETVVETPKKRKKKKKTSYKNMMAGMMSSSTPSRDPEKDKEGLRKVREVVLFLRLKRFRGWG